MKMHVGQWVKKITHQKYFQNNKMKIFDPSFDRTNFFFLMSVFYNLLKFDFYEIMEYFLEPTAVEYVCACGILSPITKLFFCRHCLQLRCAFCVNHEVRKKYLFSH